jgi:hypothetical protein
MATKARTTRKAERKAPSNRKIEDKAQYERFREFAREIETDDDPEKFDRTFRKIIPVMPKDCRSHPFAHRSVS